MTHRGDGDGEGRDSGSGDQVSAPIFELVRSTYDDGEDDHDLILWLCVGTDPAMLNY